MEAVLSLWTYSKISAITHDCLTVRKFCLSRKYFVLDLISNLPLQYAIIHLWLCFLALEKHDFKVSFCQGKVHFTNAYLFWTAMKKNIGLHLFYS